MSLSIPICLARKPLSESTVAKNVLRWGTGGLNIDGTRIENNGKTTARERNIAVQGGNFKAGKFETDGVLAGGHEGGRFPSNVILDEDAAKVLDGQTGERKSSGKYNNQSAPKDNMYGMSANRATTQYDDSGGASRFFKVVNHDDTTSKGVPMSFKIFHGDCLDTLKRAPDNSMDSIVTDPPYGLSFMGKRWDYDVPTVEIWKECLRVLKPGGHLLAFGGTRTYHRLVVAIEDAGFEIRDQIQWIYGQGFPKSMDVSKALDKEFECQSSFNVNLADIASAHTLLELREEKTGSVLGHVAIPHEAEVAKLMVIGKVESLSGQTVTFQCESESETCLNIDTLWKSTLDDPSNPGKKYITETKLKTITGSKILNLLPKLSTRATTCGQGTALKPANEPICLARKPLSESTIAKNVLKYGTGGLNIDGTRIATEDVLSIGSNNRSNSSVNFGMKDDKDAQQQHAAGRFPSNVILDEDAAQVLDGQSGVLKSGSLLPGHKRGQGKHTEDGGYVGGGTVSGSYGGDTGGASRFFYVAKASKSDRNSCADGSQSKVPNEHATVKPIKLMEYLIKLVTPEGGMVLDPFMGSGSTGVAALRNGFQFRGIEREENYFYISQARLEKEST